jgi:hypothetical protein
VDQSVYAGASDVPYSFAQMVNESVWPDGLAALETHCVQSHSDTGEESAQHKTHRLLRRIAQRLRAFFSS